MKEPLKKETTKNPFKIPAKAFNLTYLLYIFDDSAAIWLDQEINGEIVVAINPEKITPEDLKKLYTAAYYGYVDMNNIKGGTDYYVSRTPFTSWFYRFYKCLRIRTTWVEGKQVIISRELRRP